MGKEIKPSGGGILGWIKGAVFGVAKSGAFSETWKIISPYVGAAMIALATALYGIIKQAPTLAIIATAAIVFAGFAIAAVQMQAFLERRRQWRFPELEAEPAPAPARLDPELEANRRQTERTRLLDEQRQVEESAEFHAALSRYTDMTWSVQDEIDLQSRKREELKRGYSDEWKWEEAKAKGALRIQRDKPLGEALAYHVQGRWGSEFFEAVKSGLDPGGVPLERAIQLAYDDTLTIWGKRIDGGVYEIIPNGFWADHHVDLFSLMRRKAATVPNSRAAGDVSYFDLMVSRAQFEQVMPCDVASIRAAQEETGDHALSATRGPFVERMIRENKKREAGERRAARDEALKAVEEAERRRALIAGGRDVVVRFRAERASEPFEMWARRQREYLDIQPHLGAEYDRWVIRNADRDVSGIADGEFLRELARLEREWGLM